MPFTAILAEATADGVWAAINSGISTAAENVKSLINTNAPILFGVAVLSVGVSIGLGWVHKLRKAS